MLPSAAFQPPDVGQCLAGGPFSAFERPDKAVLVETNCTNAHTIEVVATGTLATTANGDSGSSGQPGGGANGQANGNGASGQPGADASGQPNGQSSGNGLSGQPGGGASEQPSGGVGGQPGGGGGLGQGGGGLPGWDSDAVRAAFAVCSQRVGEFVGGDWHAGKVFPFLTLPSSSAWSGGARTYVCGVAEASDDLFAPKERTGSLQGSLKDAGPMALTCVDLDGGELTADGFYKSVDAVMPVGCSEAHDTEFVGVWTAPAGAFPVDAQALNATVSKACFTLVAGFLGLSELQLFERKDIYTFWDGLTQAQWQLGDRVAHCFLNVSTAKTLHKSLKGLGTNPLPA
ncbi:septum formation family protein [Dactylosporangium sp. NPDC051541]|uniref:septum formation family protein n=1 Tax=Dactylosporangium sp. NPDC051541 TaxID=3363977 RepID=UPI0037A4550B